MKFNKGDKVTRIHGDTDFGARNGKTYKVRKTENNKIRLDTVAYWYEASDFELDTKGFESMVNESKVKNFKVGDKVKRTGPTYENLNIVHGEIYTIRETGLEGFCNISLQEVMGTFESYNFQLYESFEQQNSVSSPSHYNRGTIQPIDFIKDQNLSYDLGCVVKYICRAGFKDPNKHEEDLRKAITYLEHEINSLKEE